MRALKIVTGLAIIYAAIAIVAATILSLNEIATQTLILLALAGYGIAKIVKANR